MNANGAKVIYYCSPNPAANKNTSPTSSQSMSANNGTCKTLPKLKAETSNLNLTPVSADEVQNLVPNFCEESNNNLVHFKNNNGCHANSTEEVLVPNTTNSNGLNSSNYSDNLRRTTNGPAKMEIQAAEQAEANNNNNSAKFTEAEAKANKAEVEEEATANKSEFTELVDLESFAHPLKDNPAKCNLIDSIRTLFVDVIVTNAVSPLNFSIQSYKEYSKLKSMEAHMTDFYTRLIKSTETQLKFEDLMLNGFYAVKYIKIQNQTTNNNNDTLTNNNSGQQQQQQKRTEEIITWKRCQIMKPFSQSLPITTYLIDHGCYFMTEPQNIQLLKKIYCELPCQSLESKLHFLDSKKVQFTPEDCHRFHQQVEGKPFCSIIMKPLNSTASSGANGQNGKTSIILIDTSGTKDHYIHHDYSIGAKNKKY